MSVTQTTTTENSSEEIRCSRCNSILPARATFCSTCGERVEKTVDVAPALHERGEHYRVTALVRRRAAVLLLLAFDTQGQRPVAIREIDLSSLSAEARTQATSLLQQEYDLLRFQHIPDVMSVVEIRAKHAHVSTVTAWPLTTEEEANDQREQKLQTLQDLLQSGLGLPDEAVALEWIYRLCRAVQRLHQHAIVLGDLDPSTVAVNGTSYKARPAIMVSWLPLLLRTMLPRAPITDTVHFNAPEMLLGRVEPRSDVYSLGALLYLLLTGIAPDEPTLRLQHQLRSPRELNQHVSSNVDALTMRALAIESGDRFASAGALAQAIAQAYHTITSMRLDNSEQIEQEESEESREEITVSIVPLRTRLANMYLSSMRATTTEEQESEQTKPDEPLMVEGTLTPPQSIEESETLPEPLPRQLSENVSPVQRFQERLSGLLPALRLPKSVSTTADDVKPLEKQLTFWQRLQRFFLAEQQHATTAAAIIETPLRVQLNQSYIIRIHITGRDAPELPPGAKRGTLPTGLSALMKDEIVHIEVRSALYQSYAYIVQRADVTLPGNGYSAEVTIPMQSLSNGPSGRRERLHIFFTDEMRHPLYEKPFVVEVFISHLVQSGREGYNVLTIPL